MLCKGTFLLPRKQNGPPQGLQALASNEMKKSGSENQFVLELETPSVFI